MDHPIKAPERTTAEVFPQYIGGAHLSFACAEMLSARAPGSSKRAAAFTQLLAIYIAEKYTNVASKKPDYRGGLPIARLRKVEDYVSAHLEAG